MPVEWHQGAAEEVVVSSVDLALSNELVDAFPVHRLVATGDTFREIYITTDTSDNFVEVLDTPSAEAQLEVNTFPLPNLRDGDEITISSVQRRWLENMARCLRIGGYLLSIDYATDILEEGCLTYTPRVYADFLDPPTGHPVQLAYQHPGTVDITASVDFTRLTSLGSSAGLTTIYDGTQANFLCKYGFEVERDKIMNIEEKSTGHVSKMAHYFASHMLLSPEHMGGHRVLIQQKI